MEIISGEWGNTRLFPGPTSPTYRGYTVSDLGLQSLSNLRLTQVIFMTNALYSLNPVRFAKANENGTVQY